MFLQGYRPTPIEPRENALMRGLEIQRARQGNALQEMQMQAYQQQQAEAQRQREQAMGVQNAYRNALEMPLQQAAAQGMTRPTPGNAAALGQMAPRLNQQRLAQELAQVDPMAAAKMLQAEAPDAVVVGQGGALVDKRTGKPLFSNPRAQQEDDFIARMRAAGVDPASPQGRQMLMQRLQKEATHSPPVQNINYGSPVPVQLPDGSVGYVQPSNRGGPAAPMADAGGKPLVKPSDADAKALTEGQAKAVAFASRMESADKVLADLSRRGVLTTIPGGMGNNAVGSAITAMAPADQQKLMQAKRNFINAVLRRESGAVISSDEFANAERQYFPQIGEARPVIEQKARERRVAIEGMRADVPKGKQGEVDRISGGGGANNDPLGIRGN